MTRVLHVIELIFAIIGALVCVLLISPVSRKDPIPKSNFH